MAKLASSSLFLAVIAAAGIAWETRAQPCAGHWLPGEGVSGVGGYPTVDACATAVWDPDGPGPRHPLWVVAGSFPAAGEVVVNNIAAYDPTTGRWEKIGSSGTNGPVYSLLALADGGLVAAGSFDRIDNVPAVRIARWSGGSWAPIGDFLSPVPAKALLELPNGNLVAGGDSGIDLWNGAAWSRLGAVSVRALLGLPGGGFAAGGDFTFPANRVARWDGTGWSAYGSGMDRSVESLALLPNGDLVAGGSFTRAGGTPAAGLARWNGASWVALPGSFISTPSGGPSVRALAVLEDGSVLAGGSFLINGVADAACFARWDGTRWHGLGLIRDYVNSYVLSITPLPNNEWLVGGRFDTAGDISATRIAHWDGSRWSSLGKGGGEEVDDLTALPGGSIAVGGSFLSIGGVRANGIASWDGARWTALGEGMSCWPSQAASGITVSAIAPMPDGGLVAGGMFDFAGGSSALNIARWNGAGWAPMGSGVTGRVEALTLLPNGELIAGGWFLTAGGIAANRVAKWGPAGWSALGGGVTGVGLNIRVYAIEPQEDGGCVVGGRFTSAGGVPANNVARWDGTAWSALGSGVEGTNSAVYAIETLSSGELVIGGSFESAGGSTQIKHLARWDGSGWSGIAPDSIATSIQSIMRLPDNDLIVGGFFSRIGGVAAKNIARWDGAVWHPMDTGASDTVHSLALRENGELVAGGRFFLAGGQVSSHVATWTTSGVPWLAVQPEDVEVEEGATGEFSASPASGYGDQSAQWQLETAVSSGVFTDLNDGPIPGASPATSAITPLADGRVPGTTTLTIQLATMSLSGRRLRVVVSNACGQATSELAMLTVNGCRGDFNGDGQADFFDYLDFAQAFSAEDLAADFDGNGQVDFFDYLDFVQAFDAGCD